MVLAIEDLKHHLDILSSIKEVISQSEAEFYAKVDMVADHAFDDQCTGSNPRYPLISDLKDLLIQAYHGDLPLKIVQNRNGGSKKIEVLGEPQPLLS